MEARRSLAAARAMLEDEPGAVNLPRRSVHCRVATLTSGSRTMPAFDIAPNDLANLLTTSMRPKLDRVECEVDDWLELRLFGVDTGMKVMGMGLPRVDVRIALRLALAQERVAEMRWDLRSIGGLPDMLAIALPRERIGRGVVQHLVEKAQWQGCSELSDDRLLVFLDRVPMKSFRPEQIHYEELRVPGNEGHALTARLRIREG